MEKKNSNGWQIATFILIGVLVLISLGFMVPKIAGVNECGGIFNKQCSPELHCELDDYLDNTFGEVGKCFGLGGLVECGGISGEKCPEGFYCELFNPNTPDSIGRCRPEEVTPCQKKEPTTREELKAWNVELREEVGYHPEPLLLMPEKELQGKSGYFPFSSIEMDGLPVDNLMCNEFMDLFVRNNLAKVVDAIKGRNIYSQQGAYILCIENERLGIVANDKEVIDKYFEEFVC